MMGISRIVSTDFWEDGLVTDSFSPEDKYFMLYLMTNPHSKQAGIYKLNKKIAAFELGYSVETVVSLLDRFENKYHRIIYSQTDQEVAVLNAPKYNIVKGGKPVLDCIEKDLSGVKDKSLIARMYQHLKPYFEQSDKPSIQQVGEVWKKASDTFKEGSPIENDIDNDNDRIVDVSYNESSHESSDAPHQTKTFTPPTIEEVKAYCKERNNHVDPQKFIDFYETNGWVQGKARKPIKSWKACVRTWEGQDKDSDASADHTEKKKGWGGYLC